MESLRFSEFEREKGSFVVSDFLRGCSEIWERWKLSLKVVAERKIKSSRCI